MCPAISYDALRQVIVEQKEEANAIQQKRWVCRSALAQSKDLVNKDWIKVITGVRRAGKSIFAHQLLKDRHYGYINFDDERLIGLTTADLDKLLQYVLEHTPKANIFLFDEVQNIEGWQLFINRLQRQGYNLVITGSNSNLLGKELSSHLTGRYANIEIFPFSFREFLLARNFERTPNDLYKTKERAILYSHLKEYLYQGGFPQLVLEGYNGAYLRELYNTIISKDITNRYRIRFTRALREMAIFCNANLGARISFHKIKDLFDLNSLHTIKNHFEYLSAGYLVFLLESFKFDYKEQTKLPRKIYTIDNGFSAAINPKFSDQSDKALENLVFQELSRRGENFSHYDVAGVEGNFVLHKLKEPVTLLNVTWTLNRLHPNKKILKSLVKCAKTLKCNHCIILTWEDEATEKIQDLTIQILPIWKWLFSIHQ